MRHEGLCFPADAPHYMVAAWKIQAPSGSSTKLVASQKLCHCGMRELYSMHGADKIYIVQYQDLPAVSWAPSHSILCAGKQP